jgi:hypothetical protein
METKIAPALRWFLDSEPSDLSNSKATTIELALSPMASTSDIGAADPEVGECGSCSALEGQNGVHPRAVKK